jgi:hypothetical protein
MCLKRPISSSTSAYRNLLQILSPYECARNGWRLSIFISFNFKDVLYFSNWHVFYDKSECQIERYIVGNGRDLPIVLSRNFSESQRKTSKMFVIISRIPKHFGSYVGQWLVPKPDAIVTEAGGWKARIAGNKLAAVIPKHSSWFDNERKLRECQFLFTE